MKISVIVPVYKVEPFLDRCLNSIVNQTYSNLEIILVDDGSPDNCPQMCEDWAKKDHRIKIIHKQNEGLGLARNSGLAASTGEYVSFVDSDDYLDTHTYEVVLSKINDEYPDACYFSHYRLRSDGSLLVIKNAYPEKAEISEIKTQLLPLSFGQSLRKPFDTYTIGSSCMGVYRREFLTSHNISFKSERQYLCEDFIYSIEVCLSARKVTFINRPFYYYCENQNSLTLSYRKDRLERAEILYKYMVSIIKTYNLDDETTIRAKDCYLINMIVCLKQELTNKKSSFHSKIQNIRNICQSEITAQITMLYPIWQLPLKKMLLVLALKFKMSYLLFFITNMRLMKN